MQKNTTKHLKLFSSLAKFYINFVSCTLWTIDRKSKYIQFLVHYCPGNTYWSDCGSCERTCGVPDACSKACRAGCRCHGKLRWDPEINECVSKEKCTSNINFFFPVK